MKTTFLLLLVIITISCSSSSKKDSVLLKEAEVYMKEAIVEADNWLADLNQNGYSLYFDQHFPPVFEKAIFESMDSTQKKGELQKWINQVELEFGKVTERKLLGVHIITEGRLFTNDLRGKQGFKETSPKLLGLNNVKQLYLKNIDGTYAYFMYEAKPTKKERAEELIVLWLDTSNKWNFITYKIADNI